MANQPLLIEIGTEELPPANLEHLIGEFCNKVSSMLSNSRINHGEILKFATPRRLALLIKDVASNQQPKTTLKKGPPLDRAFDNDKNPTKAALGFAKTNNAEIKDLEIIKEGNGEYLFYKFEENCQNTIDLISKIVQEALEKMHMGKKMRLPETNYEFIRPIRWVLLLFGKKTINNAVFGLESSNITFGHRFLCKGKIEINDPFEYEAILEKEGFVIPSFDKRKQIIIEKIKNLKDQVIIDEDLLKTVTGLVEWPVILIGKFKEEFLEVPKESLISSMQYHQKCFPVQDNKGSLLPKFVIVSNIESNDPQTVISGNERVMHARLSDAVFLYNTDKKQTLESRLEKLKSVVFQAALGSIFDKTKRIVLLSEKIAQYLGVSIDNPGRAALLCKTDLITDMVYEFPELQGIMGAYYAKNDGESKDCALAIREHYLPKFSKDDLPTSIDGTIVALADRIDSIVGLFGISKYPTGDKDPFSLKRQALGILRIIVEKQLNLDLKELISFSCENYNNVLTNAKVVDEVMDFCFERFKAWYLDDGINPRVYSSVLTRKTSKPYDFHLRVLAVNDFLNLPEANSLAEANKRVQNILSKANIKEEDVPKVKAELLTENPEKLLYEKLKEKEEEISPMLQNHDYAKVMTSLATLKEPIDNFFDNVMVMSDDENIKANRLNLLQNLRQLFLQVADVSIL